MPIEIIDLNRHSLHEERVSIVFTLQFFDKHSSSLRLRLFFVTRLSRFKIYDFSFQINLNLTNIVIDLHEKELASFTSVSTIMKSRCNIATQRTQSGFLINYKIEMNKIDIILKLRPGSP